MSYEHHSAEKTQISLSYLQLCKAKSWTFKNKNSYWGFNCLRLEYLLEFLNCILIGRFRNTFFQTIKPFFKIFMCNCHNDYLISHRVGIDVNPSKEKENQFLRQKISIHATRSLKLVTEKIESRKISKRDGRNCNSKYYSFSI